MATFSDLVSAALNYATDHPGLTPEDIKKIRMTNIACGIQSLNIISLTLIILAFEVYSFTPMVAFELLGLFACFYLQKKGRFTLAKTLFYIPILFGVAIACAGFEEKLQVIVYGFPLTTALFLLYGRQESKVMYTLVFMSVVALIGGNLAAGFLDAFFLVPDSRILPAFTAVNSSMALTFSVLIVKGFFDESYHAEQKYIEAARVISEQKERLQTVFDTVEEGILVVGPGGRIQEGFSKYLKDLIHRPETDIIGLNAFDLLISSAHHDRDEIDQCRAALEMSLGAMEFQWSVNQTKILRELEFTFGGQRKVLVLHWQPIVRDGIITSLLLMARDITLNRLHDQIKTQQQERTQALMGIVSAMLKSSRQVVENFLSRGQQKIRAINSQDLQSTFFELHTLKGVARSLALKDIASRIHGIESALSGMKTKELGEMLDNLALYFDMNLQMIREISGASVSSVHFQNLYDVASHSRLNLYSLLEKHQLTLDFFQVDDGVIGWDSAALEMISEALQHAITNTIDHGFVFPRLRQEITAPKLQLRLKAWLEPRDTVIELVDNGNGIDDASLNALATKYGLDLTRFENPLDILFESGISTTTAVSLTSGRGVGTSAVRAAAVKLQGTASLRRNLDRGLTLRLVLPRETSLYSTHTQALRTGQEVSS